MPSAFQREVLAELRKGATLRLRSDKYGRLGDFLLIKKEKVIRVVPRKTVAAICQMSRHSLPAAIEDPIVDAPIHKREVAQTRQTPRIHSEVPLLDDLARSLAGKGFAKLSMYEQEHVRSLAARLEPR